MRWEIIEPEAVVVDSESIRLGNVLIQLTHPGPQSRPQGISTYKAVRENVREKDSWHRLRPLACSAYKQTCFRSSAVGPVAQW